MNKILVVGLFIVMILAACDQHKKNINLQYIPSDEAEVTTLAFDASIHSDTDFKRTVLNGYGINQRAKIKFDEEYIKQQNLELDSVKKELETGKIYVFIADTLVRIPKDYLQKGIKTAKQDKMPNKLGIDVSSWASEININENPGMFNLENLAFDYNYKYTLQSGIKPAFDKKFSPGIFRMSAIFFNSAKTKAFVYTEIKYHRGYEMFFIKKNGKWSIVKNHLVWIT